MKGSSALPWAAVIATAFAVCTFGAKSAQAGTYANITVQGEPAGTEFNDWVGITVLAMDPLDNPGGPTGNPFIDIKDVQLANNEDFLFVHISYHNNSSTGTYIAIDNDQNTATGFDIFGLGLIGSEIGYVNDYPFAQDNTQFNTNVSFTGGPLGNGGALIYPFWDQDGMDKELAIPLDAFVTFPAAPAFPNPSMNIMIWTDEGLADITDVISYTLAEAPPGGVPGDYNNNNFVDAADYVLWRKGGPLQNEVATPGSVTPEDYDAWRARFGNTAGAGGGKASLANAAVPEPLSGMLLVAGASLLVIQRRRA